MSNEIYLYGLSEDNGATFASYKSMTAEQACNAANEAFAMTGGNWDWLQICSLPEALAARKMREALEDIQRHECGETLTPLGTIPTIEEVRATLRQQEIENALSKLEEVRSCDPTPLISLRLVVSELRAERPEFIGSFKHGMIPGSHEHGGAGPMCWCGTEWERSDGICWRMFQATRLRASRGQNAGALAREALAALKGHS